VNENKKIAFMKTLEHSKLQECITPVQDVLLSFSYLETGRFRYTKL